MNTAHVNAVMIVGEPFMNVAPYDFQRQNITQRIHELIPIMLKCASAAHNTRCPHSQFLGIG